MRVPIDQKMEELVNQIRGFEEDIKGEVFDIRVGR